MDNVADHIYDAILRREQAIAARDELINRYRVRITELEKEIDRLTGDDGEQTQSA